MYSNIFDTVRTSDWDQYNVTGTLYTSLLSGLHPTFALNQAVDNKAFITLCQQHPEVLELIADGTIRIAAYKKFYNGETQIDPIFGYFYNALTYPEPSSGKAPFKFSSLPFSEQYDPTLMKLIYDRMRAVLRGEYKHFSTNLWCDESFPKMADKDIALIDQHLITVQRIMEAARGQYLMPSDKQNVNNKLSYRLKYARDKLNESDEQVMPDFVQGIDALLEYIQKNAGKPALIESRSNLYNVIDHMDSNAQHSTELKEFVDLCYNEVVATSICDNEEDLIAACKEHSNIGIYVRSDDPDYLASGQKFELLNHSISDRDTLSWPKLKSVLAEAKSLKVGTEEWKESMEDILYRHEIKSLHLAGKQFITGSFNFVVGILQMYDGFNKFSNIQMTTVDDLIPAGIDLLSGSADLISGVPKIKELSSMRKDADDYRKMQDRLTQTTYLRRDYAEKPEN